MSAISVKSHIESNRAPLYLEFIQRLILKVRLDWNLQMSARSTGIGNEPRPILTEIGLAKRQVTSYLTPLQRIKILHNVSGVPAAPMSMNKGRHLQ